MATEARTNAQWKALIEAKIAAIENDSSTIKDLSNGLQGPAVAKLIDHTLLKPDSTDRQIDQLCNEAKQYGFMVGTSKPP